MKLNNEIRQKCFAVSFHLSEASQWKKKTSESAAQTETLNNKRKFPKSFYNKQQQQQWEKNRVQNVSHPINKTFILSPAFYLSAFLL